MTKLLNDLISSATLPPLLDFALNLPSRQQKPSREKILWVEKELGQQQVGGLSERL